MRNSKTYTSKPWGGLTATEYAALRYTARKHLENRLKRSK